MHRKRGTHQNVLFWMIFAEFDVNTRMGNVYTRAGSFTAQKHGQLLHGDSHCFIFSPCIVSAAASLFHFVILTNIWKKLQEGCRLKFWGWIAIRISSLLLNGDWLYGSLYGWWALCMNLLMKQRFIKYLFERLEFLQSFWIIFWLQFNLFSIIIKYNKGTINVWDFYI